jgi:Alcohol dehydrogenase GroES-like domain
MVQTAYGSLTIGLDLKSGQSVLIRGGSLSNQWTVHDFAPNEYLPKDVRLADYSGDAADLPRQALRSGAFPLLGEPPFILGWDLSGIVEAVDPGVSRFTVGDEVYGMPYFPRAVGAYAEFVAAPSRQLARKPASLSHVEAAGLPLVGLTAWQSLVDIA